MIVRCVPLILTFPLTNLFLKLLEPCCAQQLFFLRRPVNSLVPGAPRAPLLIQHHVGLDKETG